MLDPARTIVENLGDAVIIFDGQSYRQRDLGKQGAFFVYPDDRQIAYECFHRILEAAGCSTEFRQSDAEDTAFGCRVLIDALPLPTTMRLHVRDSLMAQRLQAYCSV